MKLIATFLLIITIPITLLTIIRLLHKPKQQQHILSVLGSGGHTREMMHLLSLINIEQISFVFADSDILSESTAKKVYGQAKFYKIKRSRQVKQSYFTAVFTTIKSIIQSAQLILKMKPSLLLVNGPGTAVPVILICWLFNQLNYFDCKIVFVESYCRIKRLSMTGKITQYLADRFIVPWKQLERKGFIYIDVYPK